jgi:hypothetical protein
MDCSDMIFQLRLKYTIGTAIGESLRKPLRQAVSLRNLMPSRAFLEITCE